MRQFRRDAFEEGAASRQAEIDAINQTIADKEQAIADKEQIIADKEQAIADKEQIIAAYEAKYGKLDDLKTT